MIKKLLPTMIGAALAGGMTAAAADVTVFGHLDTSIDMVDADFGPGNSQDDTNLHCNTCSIGFKGSEDLGNGLKAIFKLDFQFNMTERNRDRSSGGSGSQEDTLETFSSSLFAETVDDSITDRDQWLGLAGGFGQVRIGTISTGYKSHGAMIDPLYRTSLQGRLHGLQTHELHSGAGEEGQGRATNTFRYDSPDFNGFKAVAHYTLDNNELTDGEDNNPYGIGGSYSNGGILVFADYITNDSETATTGDKSAWKVGGKFSMNEFAVMGQYEAGDELFAGAGDTTNWHIGGSYTMGNNLLYAAYGQRDDENLAGVDIVDADSWTIAAMHSLSKRTKVYLGYNSIEEDLGNDELDQFSLGMKHKF